MILNALDLCVIPYICKYTIFNTANYNSKPFIFDKQFMYINFFFLLNYASVLPMEKIYFASGDLM